MLYCTQILVEKPKSTEKLNCLPSDKWRFSSYSFALLSKGIIRIQNNYL